MSERYKILWPENRFVTAEQIRTWYSDAVANQEVDHVEGEVLTSKEKALALHDAGLITLGK